MFRPLVNSKSSLRRVVTLSISSTSKNNKIGLEITIRSLLSTWLIEYLIYIDRLYSIDCKEVNISSQDDID